MGSCCGLDSCKTGAPERTRTSNLRLSIPLQLSLPPCGVCGLDYIFTISGGTRIVSTDPGVSFPLSTCGTPALRLVATLRPPVSSVLPAIIRYGSTDTVSSTPPVPFPDEGSCATLASKLAMSAEGRCSIRLSYGRLETRSQCRRTPGRATVTGKNWSGQRDSNSRHPAPKAGALPDCAMPRLARRKNRRCDKTRDDTVCGLSRQCCERP